MGRRTKLRLILFTTFALSVFSPAFADEQVIELNPSTPYVDVPVTITEPVDATIQTVTGTPDSDFIDSWIELWQDTTRLAFNDDGAHSATNYLASIINMPLQVGEYFIRATSYAYRCCNALPTGQYVLQTNLAITTPSPTPSIIPTPELSPTPTETPTPEPTESPSVTPSPEPSSEQPVVPQESQPEPQQQILIPVIEASPSITPEPEPTNSPESLQIEQLEPLSTEPPLIEVEPIIVTQEQLDQEYIAENTIQFEVPTALAEIPGMTQIFAATEAILNVGSDMTKEQREESQSVVVAAIIVSQIASAVSITQRKIK